MRPLARGLQPTDSAMKLYILGPLEAHEGDRPLRLGGAKQTALLAYLAIRADEVVATDTLLQELWPGKSPTTNVVQVAVSRLRKSLGASGALIETQALGYRFALPSEALDARRFEDILAEGRAALRAGDPMRSASLLRIALGLWRGPALADFLYEPFAQPEIRRLEELRLGAVEERIEADLALGRHAELVGELEALARTHALRERLWGQWMRALYGAGRQAEALAVYHDARRVLVEELGIEPGLELRALEQAVLRQDAMLTAPAAPPPPSPPNAPLEVAPVAGMRKTVTVLFCGLASSTSLDEDLDPEIVQTLQARWYETAQSVLERHGGTVERSVGGSVMAVFGVPHVHEDDGLRAVRAAWEIRSALETFASGLQRDFGLMVTSRVGIDTGEVVAEAGDRLVSGQTVATAARIEQAAQPGEIVLSEGTFRLVGSAVSAEPLARLTRSGKERPLTGWRLLEVIPDAPAIRRRLDAPLVGRARELAQLHDAFRRVRGTGELHLFTLLGPAGIGKTRLAQELVARVREEALVLHGRCLSYGDGITYWPLLEIVREAAGADTREALSTLMDGEADATRVADLLAGAIAADTSAGSAGEVSWAARRLLETLALRKPVLVVLEDIHWAEPTFLDLIEYVADLAQDAPILLLCLTRLELLEDRPAWGGGKVNASTLLLQPLADADSHILLANLNVPSGSEELRRRVHAAAEGNPLFAEQIVAALEEEGAPGAEELPLPATIAALLAARLDGLRPAERGLIEAAAVIGKEFEESAVCDLLPPEGAPAVPRVLSDLVRRRFLRSDRSGLSFRHVLIQQAAYRSIPMPRRADLHERYAGQLEAQSVTRGFEIEEIVGYHLEQAFLARSVVGLAGETTNALGRRAGELLRSAGERAFRRADMPAAANLLGRAARLFGVEDPERTTLLPDFALALFDLGEFDRADDTLTEAVSRARLAGDRGVEWNALVIRTRCRFYIAPNKIAIDEAERNAAHALGIFRELGDDLGLARAWTLLTETHAIQGRAARAAEASDEAARYARGQGSRQEMAWNLGNLGWTMMMGPAPVAESHDRLQDLLEQEQEDRAAFALLLAALAWSSALLGRVDDARAQIAEAERGARELGLKWQGGMQSLLAGYAEMLAGDPAAAEDWFRAAIETLGASGDRWFASLASVDLARAVYEQGRYEEASELANGLDDAAAVDPEWPIKVLGLRAKLRARTGFFGEALVLAGDALAVAEGTDLVTFHVGALLDQAEVLRLANRPADAAAATQAALALSEQKGDLASAARAQRLLDDITSSPRAHH